MGKLRILSTLEVLPALLSSPYINGSLVSLASRLLISILLTLPQIPATVVSPNPAIHALIVEKITCICEGSILHDATKPWLRRDLGLFAHIVGKSRTGSISTDQALKTLDLSFHPHLPPTLRGIPQLDNIPLLRAEDKDEQETREALDLSLLGHQILHIFRPLPWWMIRSKLTRIPSRSRHPLRLLQSQSFASTTTTTMPALFSSNTAVHSSTSTATPPTLTSTAAAAPLTTTSDPRSNSLFIVPSVSPASEKGKGTARTRAGMSIKSTLGVSRLGNEESDSDDERMPEIDMGSDSD